MTAHNMKYKYGKSLFGYYFLKKKNTQSWGYFIQGIEHGHNITELYFKGRGIKNTLNLHTQKKISKHRAKVHKYNEQLT